LAGIDDKVPFLAVFATRVRDGRSSRSKKPVRAGTVADAILAVAKTFTALGAPDPRLNSIGKIDPRLANMYTAMRKEDPPPNRVKPVPIQLLHYAQSKVEV
jgi:hypothetical protein